jgi:hypothetical protein
MEAACPASNAAGAAEELPRLLGATVTAPMLRGGDTDATYGCAHWGKRANASELTLTLMGGRAAFDANEDEVEPAFESAEPNGPVLFRMDHATPLVLAGADAL